MKKRCEWSEGMYPEYMAYHDEEWGVPVHDDKVHFEFLILEGAQAGLSWSTVLKKRDGYRQAFADFEVGKVASFDENQVLKILESPAIIRNKLKVRSCISNAKAFMKVQDEFGSFDNYIWRFVEGSVIHGDWDSMEEVPATTKESDALSRDLKKRGFKFVGSTIMYAHMQATGLVNDHTKDCFCYQSIKNYNS